VLVRRFSDAAVTELHRLRPHVLMDAGELGSRNLSVNWLEVPAGASEELRSHEEAEQVYVVAQGSCTISATGDTQLLQPGDLAFISPATDHSISNEGSDAVGLISIQSPGVSVDEVYSRRLAAQAAGYDDDEYE
jgi:mannose-6-phosphate isomerase-like protein (cupin superfamily)